MRTPAVGYNVVKAAASYSAVTGLVSGFALTAVVLVFTIAATLHNLHYAQKVDLGFATTLFALGFVGCLLCAYAFASISGEPDSPAALTYSMLVGSALIVCLVAVLGGFEALSRAFLHDSSFVFLVVCTVLASVAPAFNWFPQWDILQNFGPPPPGSGRPESLDDAVVLIVRLSLLGALAAVGGFWFQRSGVLSPPRQWEYLVLTFTGLAFTVVAVLTGLRIAMQTDHRARLTTRMTWYVGLVQSATIFLMIALLP